MRYLIIGIIFIFLGCSSKSPRHHITDVSHPKTSIEGERILRQGKIMALEDKEIIRGGCWDYIDTLFTRAGFSRSKRIYAFKTKKNRPPYAHQDMIKPGDWLYFINQGYGKVEHSGVFVRWRDKSNSKAVILSYGGENRKKPGRYLVYDISEVFAIIRGKR